MYLRKLARAKERVGEDVIVLFHRGDFYECYMDDAVDVANITGVSLCHQVGGSVAKCPMAGFSHYTLDTYLPLLLKADRRVAIFDE